MKSSNYSKAKTLTLIPMDERGLCHRVTQTSALCPWSFRSICKFEKRVKRATAEDPGRRKMKKGVDR